MIHKSCNNCRWNSICKSESEADQICVEYELDIFSDDYVNEFIEHKREQYRIEYIEHYAQEDSAIGGY